MTVLLTVLLALWSSGVSSQDDDESACGTTVLRLNSASGRFEPARLASLQGGRRSGPSGECVCNAGFTGRRCSAPLVPLSADEAPGAALPAWSVLPRRINESGEFYYDEVVFTASAPGTIFVLPQFAAPGADARFDVFAQRDSLPVSRSEADPAHGGISGLNSLVLPEAARWLVWLEPRSRLAPLGAPVAVRLCRNEACGLDPCGGACSTAQSFCDALSKKCGCAAGFAEPPKCERVTGASLNCPDNCSNAGTCQVGGLCKCSDGRSGVNCSLKTPLADTSGVVIGTLAGVLGFGLLIALIACIVWAKRRKRSAHVAMRDKETDRDELRLDIKDDDSNSF